MTHGPDTTARKIVGPDPPVRPQSPSEAVLHILYLLRRIDDRLTKIERKVERIYPGIRV